MKINLKSFLLNLFFLGSINLFAQIPNGSWRDHLPYSNVRSLTEVNNKIFCATTGGLFSFDKSDNSLQKYSKVNGLADVSITAINYDEKMQTLLVCYENGNIDLIKNDSIVNIPDIKRKVIVGEKIINSIFFIDDYAYLACGFGIVVLDMQKKEIKDSYLFGPMGSQIFVNDIAYDGENILASTNQGIYSAPINSPNLVDYNYWSKINNLPDPDAEYKFMVYFGGNILAIYQNPSTSRSDIIESNSIGWSVWSPEQINYRLLDIQNDNLVVVSDYNSQVFSHTFNIIYQKGTNYPQYALYDKAKNLWIADRENGLLKSVNGGLDNGIYPDGPKYPDVTELVYSNGNIWVATGAEGNRYDQRGAYLFKNEKWINYNRETIPEMQAFPNLSEIAIDPNNPDHIFGGSVGFGVIEINGTSVSIYDETNSILKTIEGFGHSYIFVTGMSFDQNNNLWVCTKYEDNPVYVRRTDGTWENIKLKYDGFGFNTRVSDIYCTKSSQIWLLLEREGIIVFRENQDKTFSERFFSAINQDGELLERVYTVTEDNDGNVWVGTSSGPIVYYNPIGIIDDTRTVIGNQILIPRNDGSSLGDYLLKNEKINCITVDGANRKWIATEKSGAFLMSSDGKKEIHKFNTETSPLFSDNVLSIAINGDNGEVFFGTDKGILSFRDQATQGSEDFKDVYVYPNPVRETYSGDITVTGLVANVNVKITDISGNLVFETTALGGQAIWDGKNFRGEKVSTGVYLVFCTNDDGTKTYVTKLLFIH